MLHDLIDQAAYMAHGYCLLWKPWLVALHAGSDLVIAISYAAIPVAIAIFVKRRPSLELKRLAWLFAGFILWCGLTHLVNLATLWWPIYETQGVIKLATAGISAYTAVMMFPLLPKALAVPSPRELQAVNARLMAEIAAHEATLKELITARAELEQRVDARTRQLSEQKELSDALVAISSQIVWTTGPTGDVVERQPGWEAFTGQAMEQYMGSGWAEAVLPEHRSGVVERWQAAIAAPEPGPVRLEYQLRNGAGAWRWVDVHAAPLFDEQHRVRGWVGMHQDITDRKEHEAHVQLLMRELSHRAKNLLAVCIAMARQTARQSGSLADFVERFANRLQGLARSHDLLVQDDWNGAPIKDLISIQVLPFVGTQTGRFEAEGPALILEPRATEVIGLALHELATNAAKYGSLSTPQGRVTLTWSVQPGADGASRLHMTWREVGGPTVSQPERRGFGQIVMERMVADTLNGHVELSFPPSGLVWTCEAPLEHVQRPDLVSGARTTSTETGGVA